MACGGVPLTLGARASAWPPRSPIQMCAVAGSSPWLVGPPPAVAAFLRFLVVSGQHLFMGRGSGNDMTSVISIKGALGGGLWRTRESRAPRFILPKRVWTVPTLTSASLEGSEGVSPDVRLGP